MFEQFNWKHPDALFNQFIKAVDENDSVGVQKCFILGLDPNGVYHYGKLLSTPMSVLVERERFDILNYLYQKGYKITEQKYVCPLIELLKKDIYTFEQVKLLYNMGADVNERDLNGNTPFNDVSCKNKLEIAQFLKEKGANLQSSNKYNVNAFGNSLYRTYNKEYFLWLLSQDIDAKQIDTTGETIVDYMKYIKLDKEIIDKTQEYIDSKIDKADYIAFLESK